MIIYTIKNTDKIEVHLKCQVYDIKEFNILKFFFIDVYNYNKMIIKYKYNLLYANLIISDTKNSSI